MLVDHPPLLQDLARNSRSGLPQRGEREGRQREYASQRERYIMSNHTNIYKSPAMYHTSYVSGMIRVQRVGHGDFSHSYNQRGGRQPDPAWMQGEDVEENGDPSDVRKMFNPYPDLVHENILGTVHEQAPFYGVYIITIVLCYICRYIQGHLLCVGCRDDDVTDQVAE